MLVLAVTLILAGLGAIFVLKQPALSVVLIGAGMMTAGV